MGNQIQMLGFYGAGFLCLALAVVKLTLAVPWSWWRVLLPLWVVLGHNALYIILGFVWLFFADNRIAEEEVTLREDNRSYFYQWAGMFCFLIFIANLVGRMEGQEETRLGLSSGRWEMIFVSGALSVVCQLLFWSRVVRRALAESPESRSRRKIQVK